MNEQQNVNNPAPKPKKKRSFWWLKLLLILVLFAAGVIAGIMLSSQAITNRLIEQYFPQYAVSEPVTTPVEIKPTEKPVEYKASPTPIPSPKVSKAPVEIISPEAQAKEEIEEQESAQVPEETEIPDVGSVAASPEPSILPAFGPAAAMEEALVPTPGAELIGIDAALDAALEHAGFQTEEVFVYSVSRERDDSLVYYDVEFGCDGKEYEYEINAFSGIVESWKTVRAGREELTAEASGSTLDLGSYVSADDAKETALFHAGYGEYDVKDLKTSLEIENNKLVYDIEFRAEGYDYDYKVDASTGIVIMREKDRD